ncbi:MAG: hypothetical protein QHC90_15915 [Shinella sp.]|nr:hypothetical protein [Shinella sp.]
MTKKIIVGARRAMRRNGYPTPGTLRKAEKRYERLRHLHRHPAPSIRALVRDLGRDFRRVRKDVTLLSAIGLIEKEDGELRADYTEIRASILLDAPAA